MNPAEPDADATNAGLLAPGSAGSPAEAATGDRALLQALLDAEAGLARAQAGLGLAPAEAAHAIGEAADAERFDLRALALRARDGGNPVIPLVADLTEAVGEWGPYVHLGATSQDIMDTALMLTAARTLEPVLAELDLTQRALSALAARHRNTVMPARTLTQHAVPTTFGLKVAGWRSMVLDARDRLTAVRDSLPAQLGGAAGTLAVFAGYGADDPLALPDAFARELGLAAPAIPWHTLRTPVADLAGALAFTAGALGKAAADVVVLSRTEAAEVAEGTGGGSSTMPHKANPVRAALLAAAARRAPALGATLYAAMSAEDERPAGAWHAEWEPLRDLLRLTGGAARDAAELAGGLRADGTAMRAHLHLTHGLLASERLAAALAPRLGRARAQALLAGLSRRAYAERRPLAELLTEAAATEPGLHAVSRAELERLCDPTGATGSAAALTDRALERP